MKKIEFSQDVIEEIIKQSTQNKKGYRKIANELKISESAVLRVLRENNIHQPFKAPRKHILNEEYFEKIDDEHKAYWLGLLYADGNITNNTIKLIQKPDESGLKLLNLFKEDTSSNYKITIRTQDSWGTITQIGYYAIYSKKMSKDLIEKGCCPNKSLVLTFPNSDILSIELRHHFIRGYFDGDGCITQNKNGERYISFVGTKDMLVNIKQELGIEANIKKETRSKKEIYSLQTGGNKSVLKIFDYLYKDATIFLERKQQRFLELKKEYNNKSLAYQ